MQSLRQLLLDHCIKQKNQLIADDQADDQFQLID